jgi:hypothetical protein
MKTKELLGLFNEKGLLPIIDDYCQPKFPESSKTYTKITRHRNGPIFYKTVDVYIYSRDIETGGIVVRPDQTNESCNIMIPLCQIMSLVLFIVFLYLTVSLYLEITRTIWCQAIWSNGSLTEFYFSQCGDHYNVTVPLKWKNCITSLYDYQCPFVAFGGQLTEANYVRITINESIMVIAIVSVMFLIILIPLLNTTLWYCERSDNHQHHSNGNYLELVEQP